MIGGLLQNNNKNSDRATAVARQRAGAGHAVLQQVLSEERNRPRHHRHAAPGASDAAGRRGQDADRRHAAAERSGLLPARQDRGHAEAGARSSRPSRPVSPPPATVRSPATCSICRRGIPMRPSNNVLRALALAALLAALGGCSEYLDRRDTISLGGGNSVATNKVTPDGRSLAARQRRPEHRVQRRRRWKPPSSAIAPTASSRRRASAHPAATSSRFEQPEQYGAGRTDGDSSRRRR